MKRNIIILIALMFMAGCYTHVGVKSTPPIPKPHYIPSSYLYFPIDQDYWWWYNYQLHTNIPYHKTTVIIKKDKPHKQIAKPKIRIRTDGTRTNSRPSIKRSQPTNISKRNNRPNN